MSNLDKNFSSLLTGLDVDAAMKYFTKADYFKFLEGYKELNKEVFEDLEKLLSSPEWKEEYTVLCRKFAEDVRSYINTKFILKRKKLQFDYVYALVSIVVPTIMDMRDANPAAQEACEILLQQYGVIFKEHTNMRVATKEEIQTGFVTRIFGIPIDKD